MAVANQRFTIYQGNKLTLDFSVVDDEGVAFSLVGYGARFAMSELDSNNDASATPIVDKNDDTPTDVAITDAGAGEVSVYLVGVDTEDLIGDYHFELEITDDADDESIVVAEGTVTVKRNIANA